MAKVHHPEAAWQRHKNFIVKLYIDDELNYSDIAKRLDEEGFSKSVSSIRRRLIEWGAKRYSDEDELRLLARRLLYLDQQGRSVSFKRFGKEISHDRIRDYINQHRSVKPSRDPLPMHIEMIESEPSHPLGSGFQLQHDLETDHNDDQLGVASKPDAEAQEETVRAPKRRRQTATTKTQSKNMTSAIPSCANDMFSEDECVIDFHKNMGHHQHPHHNLADQGESELSKAIYTLKRHLPQLTSDERLSSNMPKHAIRLVAQLLHGQGDKQSTKDETDLGVLHLAAKMNNKTAVGRILELGADINNKGGYENTPLHIAAMHASFEVLDSLLRQENVDKNAIDAFGATPLLYAITGPPYKCSCKQAPPSLSCALLIVQNGADVDIGSFEGKSALHLACAEPRLDELVKRVAARTNQINAQDQDGRTAIHIALQRRNEGYVKTLVEAGASLNVADKSGRTPLHIACRHASPELLARMIAKATDFTVKDRDDVTILHLVCQRDLPSIAAEVASKPGVDINARSLDGRTPLINASASGQIEIVRMLVENHADPGATDQAMNTALKIAIQSGHEEITEYLLDKSPLNAKNQSAKEWRDIFEHNRCAKQVDSVCISGISTSQSQQQTGSLQQDQHIPRNTSRLSQQQSLHLGGTNLTQGEPSLPASYPSGYLNTMGTHVAPSPSYDAYGPPMSWPNYPVNNTTFNVGTPAIPFSSFSLGGQFDPHCNRSYHTLSGNTNGEWHRPNGGMNSMW